MACMALATHLHILLSTKLRDPMGLLAKAISIPLWRSFTFELYHLWHFQLWTLSVFRVTCGSHLPELVRRLGPPVAAPVQAAILEVIAGRRRGEV